MALDDVQRISLDDAHQPFAPEAQKLVGDALVSAVTGRPTQGKSLKAIDGAAIDKMVAQVNAAGGDGDQVRAALEGGDLLVVEATDAGDQLAALHAAAVAGDPMFKHIAADALEVDPYKGERPAAVVVITRDDGTQLEVTIQNTDRIDEAIGQLKGDGVSDSEIKRVLQALGLAPQLPIVSPILLFPNDLAMRIREEGGWLLLERAGQPPVKIGSHIRIRQEGPRLEFVDLNSGDIVYRVTVGPGPDLLDVTIKAKGKFGHVSVPKAQAKRYNLQDRKQQLDAKTKKARKKANVTQKNAAFERRQAEEALRQPATV